MRKTKIRGGQQSIINSGLDSVGRATTGADPFDLIGYHTENAKAMRRGESGEYMSRLTPMVAHHTAVASSSRDLKW